MPGLSSEIENLISKYHKCIQKQKYFKYSLLSLTFLNRPWLKVGLISLKLMSNWYLIFTILDILRWQSLEIRTSDAVINHMMSNFTHYAIPKGVRSDNDTWFSQVIIDSKYIKSANYYRFFIITISAKKLKVMVS